MFSYNADAKGNDRLAYIGQDLYASGQALGRRIVELVGEGPVVGFIATPGQLNIQPRLDGAKEAIKASGKKIDARGGRHRPDGQRGSLAGRRLLCRTQGRQRHVRGRRGQHDVGRQGDGEVRACTPKACTPAASICCPQTLDAIAGGHLDFTIDQQPYLQGFYTVMEMAMFKFSGGLTGPAEINTGLKFVTKTSVEPYRTTKSRYEGNSSVEAVIPRSGPIGAA